MRINYTLNEDNYIIGYSIFPLNEEQPVIEVDKVYLNVSQVINGEFLLNEEQYIAQQTINKSKAEISAEMQEILQWLLANDYIINKRLLNEYTDDDPKWLAYLSDRKTKLERYNELEVQLNSL